MATRWTVARDWLVLLVPPPLPLGSEEGVISSGLVNGLRARWSGKPGRYLYADKAANTVTERATQNSGD